MLMNKTMPNTTIETPDWLREMETILEELNEGVVVLDDELRVIFANEALTRMGHFERGEIQGRTPDAIFLSEDLPPTRWFRFLLLRGTAKSVRISYHHVCTYETIRTIM